MFASNGKFFVGRRGMFASLVYSHVYNNILVNDEPLYNDTLIKL